jgi:membrane protein YdbS with pleckstrin-like domain
MQEFDHIQSLWQSHSVEVKISSDEMLQQAKKEVNAIRNKSFFNIIGMMISFVAIAVLWLFFDFNSWTTHAGLTLFLSAIAVSTFTLYRSHRLLAQHDFTTDPNEFLNSLKSYQLSRYNLYSKMYWVYAILLSFGIAMYFFEILSYFDLWAQLLIILFCFGWIIFCSTLVRKSVMKKEKERIALLIEKFERIENQFKGQ